MTNRPRLCGSSVLSLVALAFASSAWSQGQNLIDVSTELGIVVSNVAPDDRPYFMPSIMGSGVAWVDVDADSDLDLYFPLMDPSASNRLFIHKDDGTFADVSAGSGADDHGFGMGVAVGDVNNDSRVDLYLTNYGEDRLLLNRSGSDGVHFVPSPIAGDARWSSSATFCDFDGDGWLDLFVSHYIDYDETKECFADDGRADFCSPQIFEGSPDTLYRNLDGERFEDVSASTGIASKTAPGLGVVCADLDDDGRLDFYVANDGSANHLWIQQPDGSFRDEAIVAGVALNAFGVAEAGMGVAVSDADGDDDLDLFITHLGTETNTLYRNDRDLIFEDRSAAAGLSVASLPFTGFGTGFADINLDGRLDLVIANGRVQWQPARADAGEIETSMRPYAEPNQLFLGDGAGEFDSATTSSWQSLLTLVEVSRGLAIADMDGDGDVDFAIANAGGASRLYRNEIGPAGNWLSVSAKIADASRHEHSASITAVTNVGRIRRLSGPGYGYLSSHDPRAHFTFEDGVQLHHIEVRWPDGSNESYPIAEFGRVVVVVKGEGSPIPSPPTSPIKD